MGDELTARSSASSPALRAQEFELGEDATGGPCFFWQNPWTGKREIVASLLWPEHPSEVTAQVEALFADLTLTRQSVFDRLIKTAQNVITRKFCTYKARNGRDVGIEADDGEKCWIVHSDEISLLEGALRKATLPFPTPEAPESKEGE
jgi:hypothetical protein